MSKPIPELECKYSPTGFCVWIGEHVSCPCCEFYPKGQKEVGQIEGRGALK